MVKISLLIVFLLIILTDGHTQKSVIEIDNVQTEKGYIISLKNTSNIQYEVTLTLEVTNLKGYEKPITVLIPAQTSSEVLTLYFKNLYKPYDYSTSYTYKSMPSDAELLLKDKKKEDSSLTKFGTIINNGIIIFTVEGCSKCNYVANYLSKNNIDFKLIDISNSDENDKLMSDLVKKDIPSVNSVIMPVVIINGKAFHNIKNLKSFLSNLKK